MQSEEICKSCQNNFDSFAFVPLVLPCDHLVCKSCLIAEFKEQQQNKCPYCFQISLQNPEDFSSLKNIKNEIEIVDRGSDIEEEYEQVILCRDSFKLMKQSLTKMQTQVINKILKMLQKIYFSRINLYLKEIDKIMISLNQALKQHENSKKDKREQSLFQFEIDEEIFQLDQFEDMQKSLILEFQKMEEQQQSLFQQLEKVFDQFVIKDSQNNIQDIFKKAQSETESEEEKIQIKVIADQIELKTYQQAYKPNFVHKFDVKTKKLHLFDIFTERYKLVKIQQQVPYDHRSIEYQSLFYLIGGYDYSWVDKQLKKTV